MPMGKLLANNNCTRVWNQGSGSARIGYSFCVFIDFADLKCHLSILAGAGRKGRGGAEITPLPTRSACKKSEFFTKSRNHDFLDYNRIIGLDSKHTNAGNYIALLISYSIAFQSSKIILPFVIVIAVLIIAFCQYMVLKSGMLFQTVFAL